MNTNDSAPTSDCFETRLSEGLNHIASTTPMQVTGEFDPNRWPTDLNESTSRRTSSYVFAAAAAVAVTVGGLVVASGRSNERPALSDESASISGNNVPEAAPSLSTPYEPVQGEPTCGAELPVAIEIPSALRGPVPGPATLDPISDGQLTQHWELSGGTIEFRWPADSRELYDLEGSRGDRSAFSQMTVTAPTDSNRVEVAVPNMNPPANASEATLVMTGSPTELRPSCDRLQVRYIDLAGNQETRAYDVTSLGGQTASNGDPGDFFGTDLNPLVTSIGDALQAPAGTTAAGCGESDIDSDVVGPPATTPAEALERYLLSDEAMASFTSSGYREFQVSENEYQYAIVWDDGTLITVFTTTRRGADWAISHVTSVGC